MFRATLPLLYRLLFLLYAEARDLLPIREIRGYAGISLDAMRREIAEVARPMEAEAKRSLDGHFSSRSHTLYERLSLLFRVIDRGDAAVNVPKYNGGLFDSDPLLDDHFGEAGDARFLLTARLADSDLAAALDRLARDEDPKSRSLVFVDYRSLGVRQLGSIYEGLLEFRLRQASLL